MHATSQPKASQAHITLEDLPEVAADSEAANIFGAALMPVDLMVQQPGDTIGNYTLIKKIGDGGFGTVWQAEQTMPVRREAAVKILKLGMDTLEVMARFEQERQALAVMNHPNIARVFDAGTTPEGRPFFAMELVHGMPLMQYCQRKGLSLEERLRLMQEICDGVKHAHQKGIIHRDLKPSNILVTDSHGTPQPKIIDFGIAKATTTDKLTELTLMTRMDQFIGSPLYMSPEQADSNPDIDTRSDIYSLGALLYELITDQPPFDAAKLHTAGWHEMRRTIRETRPPAPSKRTRRPLPPDLDHITLHALEKNRERRYQQAGALRDDIKRFLNHEPVIARAPNTLYLVQLWLRRHRAMSAAAAVFLLTLIGALILTYRQKERAEAQERQTDTMLGIVLGVLADSRTLRQGSLREVHGLIEQIAAESARLQPNDSHFIRLETAIAQAYIGISDSTEGIPHLERAEAAALAVGAPEEDLLRIRLLLLRRLSINPAFAKKALEYAEKLQAAYSQPEEIVQVLGWKADALLNLQRIPEAIATFEEMLGHIERASPPVPASILVPARQSYARALRLADRPAEGLAAAQATAWMAEADPNVQPTDLAYALESLGLEHFKAGQFAEAIPHFEHCVSLRSPLLGPDHPLTLSAEDHLIRSTELNGDADRAQKLRRNQFIILVESIGILDMKSINRFSRLLDIYRKYNRFDDAEDFITTTLAAHRISKTDYSPKAIHLLHRVLGYYRDNLDWQRAESVGRSLLATLLRYEPNNYLIGPARAELANALEHLGRREDAVAEARLALKIFQPYKSGTKEVEAKWLPMLHKIIGASTASDS